MSTRPSHWQAPQPAARVAFDVPPGACDCHTHIHGPTAEFPFFAGRVYTPEAALPEEMSALHKHLGIERVVIVTPSVYGTDNRASVWGMKARGNTARGVAVIDDTTTAAELRDLHAAGMRGIRLNLATSGDTDTSAGRQRLAAAMARLQPLGWHVQIYTGLTMIQAMKDLVLQAPVPVVFDHFGGAKASLGTSQPGFSDLLDLLESGRAYVKVSGAYRASEQAPDYADAVPLAKALIAANPDRIVWGTDWPHPDSQGAPGMQATDLRPFHHIDDARILNQLAIWAPEAPTRRKILVDNPASLYGF